MEGSKFNVYDNPISQNKYEMAPQCTDEENAYEVTLFEEEKKPEKHEGNTNQDSDLFQVKTKTGSQNYEGNNLSIKLTIVLMILQSLFCLVTLIVSGFCLFTLLQFTQMEENYNLELNKSLSRQQNEIISINGSMFSVFNDIKEEAAAQTTSLRSDINQTKIESISLLATTKSIHLSIQQHSSDISELYQLSSGIRLVGGGQSYGRVEILYKGEWGTICDDFWDIKDARVVCRMLGYQNASSSYCCSRYGKGTGRIWLDDVSCVGIESKIHQCRKKSWGSHNCNHYSDASVSCI